MDYGDDSKCCFCISLHVGSICISIYFMLFGILCLIDPAIVASKNNAETLHWCMLGFSTLILLLNLLLMVGVIWGVRLLVKMGWIADLFFLLIWIVIAIIYIKTYYNEWIFMTFAIISILIGIYFIWILRKYSRSLF